MAFDLKAFLLKRKGAICFYVLGFVIVISWYVYSDNRNVEYINSQPYSAATIERVWIVSGRHSSGKMGHVTFTATINGQITECEADVLIGKATDYYQAGDRIKVTPRLNTCNNPLVPNLVLHNGTGF